MSEPLADGGYARKFAPQDAERLTVADPDTLLDIDAALTRLAAEDPSSAEVARFRLFAGLSLSSTSNSPITIHATEKVLEVRRPVF